MCLHHRNSCGKLSFVAVNKPSSKICPFLPRVNRVGAIGLGKYSTSTSWTPRSLYLSTVERGQLLQPGDRDFTANSAGSVPATWGLFTSFNGATLAAADTAIDRAEYK